MKASELTDIELDQLTPTEEDEELLNAYLPKEDPNYAKYRKYLQNLRQRDYATYLDIITFN